MYPCELQTQAAQFTLAVRFRSAVTELPVQFSRAYGAISAYLQELGATPAGGVYAAYHNLDMQNLDVEAGFTVTEPLPGKAEIQPGTVPAGTYAICHYAGAYEAMPPAYDDLLQFIQANGHAPAGPAYEWYLNGPDDPPPLRTDIALPVTRIAEVNRG